MRPKDFTLLYPELPAVFNNSTAGFAIKMDWALALLLSVFFKQTRELCFNFPFQNLWKIKQHGMVK